MYGLLSGSYFLPIDLRIYCDLTTIRTDKISRSPHVMYLYIGVSADVWFIVLILFLTHRSEDLL